MSSISSTRLTSTLSDTPEPIPTQIATNYATFFSSLTSSLPLTSTDFPSEPTSDIDMFSAISESEDDENQIKITQTSKKTPETDAEKLTCQTYPQYIKSLDDHTVATMVKKRTQCPKPLQLEFACAVHKKQDVFMNVGTGFGKTLAMILLLLLADGSFIVIIISQLKRLQASQADALREKYGLCAVIVNEDSLKDDAYWKTHAYDFRLKRPGSADVFISTPEQFFVAKEGYPMIFSKFVCKSVFNQQIGLIAIAEAHFVHLYGLKHYGIHPFHPAYGNLAGIKNIFGPNVPWAAMTASATHQVLQTLEKRILRPSYCTLSMTANWPNIMYATHEADEADEQL
ncbi:hypothetical protein D9758_015479 [Tetrapyrgos nigripes]|uniref:DNA 3'-5' helicase n=1 Tax=Tetrapyrgos nigripes TaxID=182062 RepID=A0A8H5FPV6_9AGAR|nr:hypothetical protein D9758_015479 [Tetrapyrgos nigripes]